MSSGQHWTTLYAKLWPAFFPKEVFVPDDARAALISFFYCFFRSIWTEQEAQTSRDHEGSLELESEKTPRQIFGTKLFLSKTTVIYIDVQRLRQAVQVWCTPYLQPRDSSRVIEDAMAEAANRVAVNGVLPVLSLITHQLEAELVARPVEVSGWIGIALSRLANELNPYLPSSTNDGFPQMDPSMPMNDPNTGNMGALIISPSFFNLSNTLQFQDIKSSVVGQLVSLEGHVVRVSPCRPLISSGCFRCGKCGEGTWVTFEDGLFNPPLECPVRRCKHRFLDFDRSTVRTIEFQRIKISEQDTIDSESSAESSSRPATSDGQPPRKQWRDESGSKWSSKTTNTARIPKTLEVEIRSDLVNTCLAGDEIRVVGVVKTIQLDAPRGGRVAGSSGDRHMESGLHQLYLHAKSIVCMKSSGDRHKSSFEDGSGNVGGNLLFNSGTLGSDGGTTFNKHVDGGTQHMSRRVADFSQVECNFIRQLALSPHCLGLLLNSFCPIIYGHELVKFGFLLSLFGGTNPDMLPAVPTPEGIHEVPGSMSIRSNIHVLVVGDPGLGKSQMLRSAAAIAPRAVLVTGNTTTTAGLTVAITKDQTGRNAGGELCIEAGALILADQGVCCIDELDKITCDQHALLEAMEQQSISIAKGGVVTSLRSNTAVLAAANPIAGHYNRRKSVCENLKMNAALLSRFDLVFILLDRPDEDRDKLISEHIMGLSTTGKPMDNSDDWFTGLIVDDASGDSLTMSQYLRRQVRKAMMFAENKKKGMSSPDCILPPLLLPEQFKRYIEYARLYCNPSLSRSAARVLQKMYLHMRSEHSSAGGGQETLPVTTRHLESLIRLAQARARMELRDEVTASDAEDVVRLLQESLLDVYTDESGRIDRTRKGGMSLAKQMKLLLQGLLREVSLRGGNNMFHKSEIIQVCQKLRLDKDVDELIDALRTECYMLLKGPKLYQVKT